MMSVGLHCRIAGRPGRTAGLIKFLDYIKSKEQASYKHRVQVDCRLCVALPGWHREVDKTGVAVVSTRRRFRRFHSIWIADCVFNSPFCTALHCVCRHLQTQPPPILPKGLDCKED